MRPSDRFHGVFAATLTPFSPKGTIDTALLDGHFRQMAAIQGLRGVLCNGHAAENHLLARAEMRTIVEAACAALHPQGLVVSGVLGEATEDAVARAQDARAAGADAIAVFPPFSWAVAADADRIVAHHTAIARAVDLPMVLYLTHAGAGDMHYGPAVLERLLRIDTVVAIKEGSWNTITYERTRGLVHAMAPHVAVLASGDEVLYPSFVLGTEGSMVSLACIAGREIVALLEAVRAGEHTHALALHRVLQPLANFIYGRAPAALAAARLKSAMTLLGHWPASAPRPPAGSLSSNELTELQAVLARAGLMPERVNA